MPIPRLNRRQMLAGAAAFSLATLGGGAGAQDDGPIHRGGVPLIALPHLPEHLTEIDGDRWEPAWLRTLLYDAPLRTLPTGNIVAAVSIGLGLDRGELQVDLLPRPGVSFATGAPMTATDLAASIESAIETSDEDAAWRWQRIASVDIGDGRVHLRLGEPDATLPATMASPLVAVTPGGAPIAPVPLDRLPPGTGPFVPYRADGQTIRCRPNRGYWVLGQPRFDGCVVTTVGNEIERTSRLVTGLVDIIPDVPALDIPLLQNDPGVSVTGDISRRQVAMVLNLNREPLNDVRVRQAIAAAIDRPALVDGATAGTAVPSWTLFPSDHWAGVPDIEPAQPSAPEATRAALAALDLLPGWSLRLACPDDQPTLANTAILLQEQLGAIGIALGIDLLDAATLDTARAEGEFDLMMTFLPSWVDPHEIAYPWLHSAGPRNAGGFVSPRIDRLLDRARSQPDEIVRGALYADIQHIMFDQVPLVPLFATPWVDAVRARVAGYTAQLPPSARGIASAWFEAP